MTHRILASRTLPAFAAILTAGWANAASAAVIFEGTSSIDLTLLSVNSAGPLDGFTMTIDSDGIAGDSSEGDGTAEGSSQTITTNLDPLGLGLGFDVSVEALVNGEPGQAPSSEGLAEATADQIAVISLDNQSASDVTVVFDVAYFVDAFVTTDSTNPLEDAFVFADAELLVNGNDTFMFSSAADLSAGMSETLDGFETLTVQIAAGNFADIELFVIAGGFVVSEVPVLGALPLFMTGLTGMLFLRRRSTS